MTKDKWLKFAVCFIPMLLLLVDTPSGMNPKAWQLFPFYIGTIMAIMLRPMGEAPILMIFLGLYAVSMNGLSVALSGFSIGMVWLVTGAYFIAQAFRDTNLGRRIAYLLIRAFGRTSLGLGYAAAFSDFIIAPVTPSNAARTGGIIWPIFRSIAEALDSYPEKNPRGIGAYLAQLLYIISMCTGLTFLTGYAANTVAWTFADQLLGLKISWIQWTSAFIVPAGIMLLLAPIVIYKIFPPTIKKIDNITIAKNGQIWTTLTWYGGILGMATALNKFGFFMWMAKLLQTYVDFSSFSHIGLLISMVALGTACRYLFVSCGAYMASVLPVQFTIGLAAGLPQWDMFLMFTTCGVMGALVTHYANAAGPVLFGANYVSVKTWWSIGLFYTLLSYVVFTIIGIPWWSMLGIFSSL